MALPSRVLNSGVTSFSTVAICGEGASDVSAAGSTSSDATSLSSIYNRISTVAAGAGVKLPPTEMGATVFVANAGANPLTVYPYDTGSTIGGSSGSGSGRGGFGLQVREGSRRRNRFQVPAV